MTPQAFGYESFTPHDLMLIVLIMFCTDVLSTWAESAASGEILGNAESGGRLRGSVSSSWFSCVAKHECRGTSGKI